MEALNKLVPADQPKLTLPDVKFHRSIGEYAEKAYSIRGDLLTPEAYAAHLEEVLLHTAAEESKIVVLFPEGRPTRRETFAEYCDSGGYQPIERDILQEVTASGLRGRGGAGFPVGRKWSVAAETGVMPRYIVCNAGEDE